ncbi:hypothetical protein [Virgibacillus litoralis]|uniref:Uncharacterized protein n=1 Tax=Virgibacillus litoralis TaxID=578221 RepID=A0ABS4HIE1_9BACI|nr:hypothetical protein [Virgibacillus litoralis]MBP1950696.1 hypothetical protein [Virgibacillus litoralis]
MSNDKNNIERTTRLIITLTIFGGMWFLFKGAIALWISTFSTTAFTKSIINIEYVLSVITLTVILVITIKVLIYVYTELKTFQFFINIEDKEKLQKNADIKYGDIFKTIKYIINGLFGIAILSIIIELVAKPHLIISILIGTLSVTLLFCLSLFVKKENVKKVITTIEKIEEKISPYNFLLYIGVLILFVGICISLVSLNQNQIVEVEFKNNKNVILNANIQNIENVEMAITIYNEKNGEETNLDIAHTEFSQDLVEVYEKNSTENTKLYIDKSQHQYHYSMNLDKYLIEGNNQIELKISNQKSSNSKIVRIVNDIEKNGSKMEISEEKFIVKP